MKNRESVQRVLLDTNFILPSLGVDVGEDVLRSLKKLADAGSEIYYSRFSILECLWIASRLAADESAAAERINIGLKSVMDSHRYRKVDEDSKVLSDALALYTMGHKDMLDNILYASSLHLGLKFLTLDKELTQFIRERRLEDTMTSPSQLV